MVDLAVLIIAVALAIALGLWLFANLGVLVAVVVLVLVVGLAFSALGALLDSVAWFFSMLRRRQPPVVEVPPSQEPTRPPSVLEALEGAVISIREAVANERRTATLLTDTERVLMSQVEERKDFVRTQRLDFILCWLLGEAWHYPSWSERDDAATWLKLPLADISGSDDKEGRRKTIRFTLHGTPLQLKLDVHRRYDFDSDDDYGELTLLSEDGETLLALAVVQSVDAEYRRWRSTGVRAFKPGDWVPSLVALYEQAQLEQQRQRFLNEAGPAKLTELKDAFDL